MINLTSSNNNNLCKNLVVIDGIPGCGKTMLSSVVSSFSRIEMLKYSYEIENFCQLYDFQLLDRNTSSQLIKNQLNYLLYNNMMGREMNFRFSDISSAFNQPNKLKNFTRLFTKGDEAIPNKIINEQPILHIATHGLTGISQPLFDAMPDGMLFINMRRHPLFLLRQNIWNMSNLINNQRSFWLYYDKHEKSNPFFYFNNEKLFYEANPKEKAIYFINWYLNKQKNNLDIRNQSSYYELTFESFVIDPYIHIKEICNKLDTNTTSLTPKILAKEKIPRKILTDSRVRDIYKRVGWVKSKSKNIESEFEDVRKWAYEDISNEAKKILDSICEEYDAS
jgi:hypothetical protein